MKKKLKFYKYHGAGNDFIILDNRNSGFDINDTEKIKFLCHRRFGIGADGILLLEKHPKYDFEMLYFNSDGSTGAMCGNGGRCIVDFAYNILKIIKNPNHVKFLAADGEHEAKILKDGQIKLKMQDVLNISEKNNLPFVCQGTTPHTVIFVKNLENFPVFETGRKIRYSIEGGTNANFAEIKNGIIHVRIYERGVENETLACGTGAVSVAIASHHLGKITSKTCKIRMPGGELVVKFEPRVSARQDLANLAKDSIKYKNIWLTGPAVCVFEGEI